MLKRFGWPDDRSYGVFDAVKNLNPVPQLDSRFKNGSAATKKKLTFRTMGKLR